MPSDDRDLLMVLKAELEFLEIEGYRHSLCCPMETTVHLRGLTDLHEPWQERQSATVHRVYFDEFRSCGLPQREDSL